jgi:hypothetical protein
MNQPIQFFQIFRSKPGSGEGAHRKIKHKPFQHLNNYQLGVCLRQPYFITVFPI